MSVMAELSEDQEQRRNANVNYAHFARRMDAFASQISLDALRRFVAVAECGGFRQASREINIAQPSISRSVRELELLLEARLFHRGSNGVELTQIGSALLKHAQILFADMRRAVDEIESMRSQISGEIIIAANPSVTPCLLPRAISALSKEAPGAKIYVVEARLDHIVAGVAEGEFEIGLVPPPEKDVDSALHTELVGSFPYVVVCSPAHPLASKRNVTLEDLSRHSWILPEPGTVGAKRLQSFLSPSSDYEPLGNVRSNSPSVVKGLTIEGGHLAALPIFSVWNEICDGRLARVKIDGLQIMHQTACVRRSVETLPPATRLLVRVLRQTCKALNEEMKT